MSKHKYSKEFLERTGLNLEKINPSKAPAEEEPDFRESTIAKTPELSERAIGLNRVRDGGGWRYSLVTIDYDPVTKVVGSVKEVFGDNSKEEITTQFKLLVDELNLFYYER